MPSSIGAAAVLALLSVANAERSLLAHKASGGSSLHALAVTDDNTAALYYTTNGNGTWAQNANRAYQQFSACIGAGATLATRGVSPVYKVGSGITGVTFPSRLLGVAVGLGCTFSTGYTPDQNGNAVLASAITTDYTPNVLTTFDQGATWQQVTGFSTTPKSFAQTAQPQSNVANAPLAPAANVAGPAPDLMATHCTTRSLCFAVGGYFGVVTGSPTVTRDAAAKIHVPAPNPASTTTTFPVLAAASLPVAGAIIRSTNGGTFWSYVTLPVMVAAGSTTIAVGAPQPVPGLMDISTDSSGRHVYAVGAPFFNYDYQPATAATNVAPTSFGPGQTLAGAAPANVFAGPLGATAVTTPSAPVATGTILYSGSYGVSNSWVVQTAPAIPGMWYGLNAVTVLRGHTSLAVGGSPFGIALDSYQALVVGVPAVGGNAAIAATYSAAAAAPLQQSGILLATLNGGFTWLSMPLPAWSYYTDSTTPLAPKLVTVTSNSGQLPALMDVACYAATVAGSAYYNCMAVGKYGYVVKTQIPAVSVANSISTISSVLTNPTWAWTYQNITQVAQTTGYLDLYGITWDNNVVGYMYGESTILSTHDGGVTWVAETPNTMITGAAASNVVAVAAVPTTY